jgi:hypothetical protein
MTAIRRPWSDHEFAQLRKMADKFWEQELQRNWVAAGQPSTRKRGNLALL